MLFAGRDLGDETTSEYVIDITKQTKAALRESEERLSLASGKRFASTRRAKPTLRRM
jgi:hypothetical protein